MPSFPRPLPVPETIQLGRTCTMCRSQVVFRYMFDKAIRKFQEDTREEKRSEDGNRRVAEKGRGFGFV